MNSRIYNFGAGPAMLPEPILKEAQEELLNWQHKGMSILEIGHRTPEFTDLLNHAEQNLRDLLTIPSNYKVLFFGGAARTHFASVPMNLLNPDEQGAYLLTGIWSQMAYLEAKNLKNVYVMANSDSDNFRSIPNRTTWEVRENTSYLYYCPNETVNGIRFPFVPEVNNIPIIADMTSCLLTEPIDVSRYGLIFAGAQKNIANAGLTLVIVREDLLLNDPCPPVPTMLNYKAQAEHHSIYATPPTFNCYLAAKMFAWVKSEGGLEAFYQENCAKAAALYDYIDSSNFYVNQVEKEARSLVNICFTLQNPTLEKQFIQQAEKRGLCALQGHRFVGGLRASLYNAMPMSGVMALMEFMADFAKENRS